MKNLSTTIDIQAPPERVWPIMSDVERWHEWTPSIRKVVRLDSGPMGMGSRVRVHQPRLPVAFWQVTEWQPGRSFTWVSRNPGVRVTARHAIEPTAAGSRVTLSLQYEGIFGALLARVTRGITLRYVDLEARGLKARSESAG
jgi:hypothetical protein